MNGIGKVTIAKLQNRLAQCTHCTNQRGSWTCPASCCSLKHEEPCMLCGIMKSHNPEHLKRLLEWECEDRNIAKGFYWAKQSDLNTTYQDITIVKVTKDNNVYSLGWDAPGKLEWWIFYMKIERPKWLDNPCAPISLTQTSDEEVVEYRHKIWEFMKIHNLTKEFGVYMKVDENG